MRSWVGRHRGLAAFVAGALLVFVALAAAGYFVLADQRRAARVLAAALSRALAREVRIDRVTELGTERVVMRGVRLPKAGGWPADVVAEQVEATGPLLAAARGDEAPVRLLVTRPTVEVAERGTGVDLAVLDQVREGLASFLTGATLLDVTLTGGTGRRAGGGAGQRAEGTVEFDLALRKGRDATSAELTLRGPQGAPLVLTADARMEGQTARLTLVARGGLTPASPWMSSGAAAALAGRSLALRLDIELAPSRVAIARGGLTVSDVVAVEGQATARDGVLRATLSRVDADLAVAAAVAGLGWRPAGRAELADVAVTWGPDTGVAPTLAALVHVPALELPAAGVGIGVVAEGIEGRVSVEPAAAGPVAHGAARVARLRAMDLDVAPADSRYRLSLDSHGTVLRADLDELSARVAGAALRGSIGYDVVRGRVDARLGGEAVDVAGLVRRVAPGWLGAADRVRVAGLRVTVSGLDPAGLGAGTALLETRGLAIVRSDGDLSGARAIVRATLREKGLTLSVEGDRVHGALPILRGVVPRVDASLDLIRPVASGFELQGASLTGRDGEGRELVTAALRPASPGRVAVSARLPDLQRLGSLWPDVERRVNGSATLDVELTGPGFRAADGRLELRVTEAELFGGKVSVRDLLGEVPVRRGAGTPGVPPWGRVEVGELIGYGLVVRDLTTPARVWNDRLSLNDLSYALYSGDGKGWAEVEIEPAGLFVKGELTGDRLRVEEFIGAYGIRGGTMTGLLRYDLDVQYRAGRVGVNGRLEVPQGGTVNIELLNRLLVHAGADPTGVLRAALENLRAFDYKSAEADVRSSGNGEGDVRVTLALKGRERLGIFPPRVREINVRNLPLSFLARQFPGH